MDLYRMWKRSAYNFDLVITMPTLSLMTPDYVSHIKSGVSTGLHRALKQASAHPFFQIEWTNPDGQRMTPDQIKQLTGKDVEVVDLNWNDVEADVDAVRDMAINDNEKKVAVEKLVDDITNRIVAIRQRGNYPVMPHP